ncbi:hypothetical protein [Paractinoplanes maris]|uniref:hypothetical protein n=1 Tax=Paractinoplanes maris TaxID=1734446 RepID=UPI0020223713|nr:hypothetical protein [Actinoplanes maris]
MKKIACVITAAAALGAITVSPAAAATASTPRCTSIRPQADFYAGGRIASMPIADNNPGCTTISVSNIRDVARPADRCQTFLVALLSADGRDPTYTEPVRACSIPAGKRTVLATGVPAGTSFRVIYAIDYLEPQPQTVRYRVWR